MDCQTIMKGQVEAQEHAKTSGHINFGEVPGTNTEIYWIFKPNWLF